MKINVLNNKFIKLLFAIFIGVVVFITSPKMFHNIANLDLLLIVAPVVILSFYYLARKYENYYLFVLASLILFFSVFVNIQVGLLLVLIFPLIYLTDEFKNKNWKDGLSASVIILGIYLLIALWIQSCIPGYKKISLFTFVFNMGGMILMLSWLAWIQRGLPSARKALAFCLPAILLLLLWVSYKDTGKEMVSVIQNGNDIIIKSFIFKNIFFKSIWSFPLTVLKIFLLILGCMQLYKKQLGILVLLVILMISIPIGFIPEKELATVLNVFIAIVSGLGIVKFIELLEKNSKDIC